MELNMHIPNVSGQTTSATSQVEKLNTSEKTLKAQLNKIEDTLANIKKPAPMAPISAYGISHYSPEKLNRAKVELYIQDESANPTGTHKYRLGMSALKFYKEIILERLKEKNYNPLPHLSMYSSGNGAYSVQMALKECGLPHLKVVLAFSAPDGVEEKCKEVGCEVFLHPMGVPWIDVPKFTDNTEGKDFDECKKKHTAYEDLISQILQGPGKSSPDIICMPYGSGQMFSETLNYLEKYEPKPPILLLGVRSDAGNMRADKTYGNSDEDLKVDREKIKELKGKNILREGSEIHAVSEKNTKYGEYALALHGIDAEPSAALPMALMYDDKIPENLFTDIAGDIGRAPVMVMVNTGLGESGWNSLKNWNQDAIAKKREHDMKQDFRTSKL
jgi:threonine dehydratase